MKKIVLGIVVVFGLLILNTSCTKNQRAKQFGGNIDYSIPANEKFVNITWKEDEMWIVTRKRISTDKREVFYFTEKSSFGLMEGKVTLTEK